MPSDILSKSGKLTEYEFEIVKTHPAVGYEIIAAIKFPWPIKEMVLQHHERFDGSGYPSNLKGEQIVPEARLIAVADVVESISANRPYRPALGIDAGLAEIKRGRGTAYDPVFVDACIKVFQQDNFQW